MKAISLIQPWATLLSIGEKRFETRSWATRYRGPIAIHASRRTRESFDWCETEPYLSLLIGNGYDAAVNVPFGAVIATATLVDCVPTGTIWLHNQLTDQERALGDFSSGRFAWMFRDLRILPAPIPHRGYPGLWEFDRSLLTAEVPS